MKLAILLACVLASGCAVTKKLTDPAALTFEADSTWQTSGKFTHWIDSQRRYTGSIGRAAILMEVDLTKSIELRYGIEHRSFIEYTGDRGEERALMGIKWKPFRRE